MNSGDEDDSDDNYDSNDNSTSKSGVGVSVADVSSSNSGGDDNESVNGVDTGTNAPFYRLDSNFGDVPYWNNGSIIATDTE